MSSKTYGMMKKILLFILVFSVLMLSGCIQEVEEVKKDDRCGKWETGRCTKYRHGFYYHAGQNECILFDNQACSEPPFKARDECEKVCVD